MKTFNTAIIACVIAAAAGSSAFASNNGLTAADQQFVNAQGMSDTYATSASQLAPATASSARIAPLSDAERINITHQQEKFGS